MFRHVGNSLLALLCLAAAVAARGDQSTGAVTPPRTLEETIPELVSAAEGSDTTARNQAITAIGHIASNASDPPSAAFWPALDPAGRERWLKSHQQERARADAILAAIAPVIPTLVKMANDADVGVRGEAIWALGEIGPRAKAAAPVFARLLDDPSAPASVRRYAPRALQNLLGVDAIPMLAPMLAGDAPDLDIALASLEALRRLGPAAAPALANALTLKDARLRVVAAEALGRLGPDAVGAADPLRARASSDPERAVRTAALIALTRIVPSIQPIASLLEQIVADVNEDVEMCNTAGDALSKLAVAARFDSTRCARHPRAPHLLDDERHRDAERLYQVVFPSAAAASLTTGGLKSTPVFGDYSNPLEWFVVGCVEPAGHVQEAKTSLEKHLPPAADPFASRLVALRVDANGAAAGAREMTLAPGATLVTCTETTIDTPVSPARLPIVTLKYATMHTEHGTTSQISWLAAIDTQSMRTMYRLPIDVTSITARGEMNFDQLMTERRDERRIDLSGRLSGQTATVRVEPAPLEVRYARAPLSSPFHEFGSPMLVSAAAVVNGPWLRISMRPVGWSWTSKAVDPAPASGTRQTLASAWFQELAPTDPEDRIRFWRAQLKHPYLMVRVAAAGELSRTPDRTADTIPDIAAILTARSGLAIQVAQPLAAFGARAVPPVAALLHHERADVRRAAAMTLGSIGAPAREALQAAMNDPQTQEIAVEAFEKVADASATAAVPALVRLLDQCRDRTRSRMTCFHVVRALGAIGPNASAAAPGLRRLVDDRADGSSTYMAELAAEALFKVGDRQAARDALTAMALQPESAGGEMTQGVDTAVRALKTLEGRESLPTLVQVLRSGHPHAASVAADMIGAMGADAAPALPVVDELLRDPSPQIRRLALTMLVGMKAAAPLALAGRAMTDPDKEIRSGAFALMQDRGAEALPFVAPLLRIPTDTRRRDALNMIARLGPAAAGCVRDVLPLAFDRDAAIRYQATYALRAMTSGRLPLAALHPYVNPPTSERTLRAIDVVTSDVVSDGEAVPALVRWLTNDGKLVRLAAIRALHHFGARAAIAFSAVNRVAMTDPLPEVRQAARTLLLDLRRR